MPYADWLLLADPVKKRADERPAAHHDLDALVAGRGGHLTALVPHFRPSRPGDDQRLVGAGHVVATGDESDEQQEDDHTRHDEKWS